MKNLKTLLILAVTLTALPAGVNAQSVSPDVGRLEMTRGELTELLKHYQDVARSTGYSAERRKRAEQEQKLIEARLETGDFRMGDQIVLLIEGDWVAPDTLAVQGGPLVAVPQIGDIQLKGVLRSELQAHMIKELGRYYRNPVVQAEALIRLRVAGAVREQGFYHFPAKTLIGEALMGAGGLFENADLDEVEIRRGDQTIWEGETLQTAINDGSTLDQLSLRAGDELHVPVDNGNPLLSGLLRYGIPITTAVLFGIRVF